MSIHMDRKDEPSFILELISMLEAHLARVCMLIALTTTAASTSSIPPRDTSWIRGLVGSIEMMVHLLGLLSGEVT